MKNNCKIKILIFDLGNVVLKFDHRVATRKIAALSGLEEFEVYKSIFYSGIERLFDCGKISAKEFYKKISKKFIKYVTYEDFKNAWADIFKRNPGMDGLLKNLKGKFRLCLLSNTNAIHFPFVRKKFPIAGIFERYFLSYKLHICKPDKKIFSEVTKKYNVLPKECIFIDDIKEYVDDAKKLGIHAIRYKSLKGLKASLGDLGIRT